MFDRQQSIRRAVPVDVTSGDHQMAPNNPTRTVYVGTAGNLVVRLADDPTVSRTYKVAAGSRHPLQVTTFMQATSALDVMAEF